MKTIKIFLTVFLLSTGSSLYAAAFIDNFSTTRNYLTDGVGSTGWDGFIGLGTKETVNKLSSSIDRAGQLYLESVNGTYDSPWNPLGPYLYKVISGDFISTVKVTAYQDVGNNNCGLMARVPDLASGGNGEDWVSMDYFPIWSCGNFVRQANNGARTEVCHNNKRWNLDPYLRLERSGNVFRFKSSVDAATWTEMSCSPITRTDLNGLALQVGLFQATYSGSIGYVAFDDFSVDYTPAALYASGPSPSNGAGSISTYVTMSWTSSLAADSHDFYFGVNFADVNSADNTLPVGTSVYKGNLSRNTKSYTPDKLQRGTTYYWRVDENDDGLVWKGAVWSFTVTSSQAPCLLGPQDGIGWLEQSVLLPVTIDSLLPVSACQWYKVGQPSPDIPIYPDTKYYIDCNNTASVLTITNLTRQDAGKYYCIVTNSSGSTQSHSATVTIYPEAWSMKQAPIMTPWASRIDPNNVLPEYPRPQMVRSEWMNLNGLWGFQPASQNEPVPVGQTLSKTILVPFPIESAISGIMSSYDYSWYRREFEVPQDWAGKSIILNFELVDWEATVYVNGSLVGTHKGGYDPFEFDITNYINPQGTQELIVKVYDPTDTANNARGKQTKYPGGIWYTAASGIWDTVWLEPVSANYISKLRLIPDVDLQRLKVTVNTTGPGGSLSVEAVCFKDGVQIGQVTGLPNTQLNLPVPNPSLWSPEHPFLYDLKIYLKDGAQVVDEVDSYFGMRKIQIKKFDNINRIALNGQFSFEQGPLDQGFWPDGIYRAPTDDALRWDLERIKDFGFNMIRKHVKVEPRRWYYWADKLGILVWQDMPSMRGTPTSSDKTQFEVDLNQLVEDHWNNPSIILWVLFNEGWGQYDTNRLTNAIMAKDPNRLVTCASGWSDSAVGHILDHHAYPSPPSPTPTSTRASVAGEYGGIAYRIDGHLWTSGSWGYTQVYSAQELLNLYESLMSQVINFRDLPGISAAVYTQITDVESEINGLITYDRKVLKADWRQYQRLNMLRLASTATEVVPTSVKQGQSWKYTTSSPASDWYSTGFNDSSWNSGLGGFGTSGTPGAVVRTTWNTADIWIRRTFELPAMTAEEINSLYFVMHHDEAAEVYINGVLASSVTGYTTGYGQFAINQAAKNALVSGGTNLLAVHCHQTAGGQYIDAGISGPYSSYCQGQLKNDFNNDCKVDEADLFMFLSGWLDYRPDADCSDIVRAMRYDSNNDCDINMLDFAKLANEWLICDFIPDCP